VTQLHRRILKHRMVGAEDPVAQEFSFLLGLSSERLSAVLESEPAAVQAAALRYAPAHIRSAFLAERSPAERSALAAALAAPKALSKEHLLDVASTLRARAADQAHLDAGETGDIDLAVELIEERPLAEQAEMLEAHAARRPGERRGRCRPRSSTISRSSGCPDEVLTAAAMAVPTDVLARFLRDVPESVAGRALSALPRTVAGGDPGRPVAGRRADAAAARRRAPDDVRVAAEGAARPWSRRAKPRDRRRFEQWKGGGLMKTSLVLGFCAAVLAPACTIVAPGNPRRRDDDDHSDSAAARTHCRPPKPLTASLLVVANLDRSSANLADRYAKVMHGLSAYLESVGLQLENMGLIATYGDHYGPRLLLGRRAGARPARRWRRCSRPDRRRTSRTTTTCCRSSATRWAHQPTTICRSR
jgi:hypothetical protein